MNPDIVPGWHTEPGPRIEGSRDLDSAKLQAPCIVENPDGGFRLFYTAVGPARPYPQCQGYILSAVSEDGLAFTTEPGIRLAPQSTIPHMSLRLLAPSVTRLPDGRWRMYVEARGTADRPTVITSAVSEDLLSWEHEPGIRLETADGLGGPRFLWLPDGRGRLLACADDYGRAGLPGGTRVGKNVISAESSDGLEFVFESGRRMTSRQGEWDRVGITAAQLLEPTTDNSSWTLIYSAWQDAPEGSVVPVHPSDPASLQAPDRELDFAAASIAADISGFRSRIFRARSADGLVFDQPECILAGEGYDGDGIDAVHAEDMSVIRLGDGRQRMYYAACDTDGTWRIASAVTGASGDSEPETLPVSTMFQMLEGLSPPMLLSPDDVQQQGESPD
ncbi:MAG: hypothetical protein QF363_22215 [Planctomycetaceae bacterium]|nr:hypothetical protein [Planctomycetaceae bacterium]